MFILTQVTFGTIVVTIIFVALAVYGAYKLYQEVKGTVKGFGLSQLGNH